MSTKTTTVTTCDRPRCGAIISTKEDEEASAAPKRAADLRVLRFAEPDIVYQDLCDRCTETIANYCDRIEKKPIEKPEKEDGTGTGEGGTDPVDPLEPDPPVGGES